MPDKALIVVTHLLGVGHLVRSIAIGRALCNAGWRVTIASGGRAAAHVEVGACSLLQIPPVFCRGTDFRTLLKPDGSVADAEWMDTRLAALLETFDKEDPSVVITELYPFGRRQLAAEFDQLLTHARAAKRRPAILCSIRDVLHPPSDERRAGWTLARLGRFYDAVLFHGDPAVAPLSASWPVATALERRLRTTGYVRDGEKSPEILIPPDSHADVLVSAGGSDAGLNLCRAAVEAARLRPGKTWRVLVGQTIGTSDFAAMRDAAGPTTAVERTRPDFPALLAGATVSVSQAGYNTMLDLAATRARAVVVPFAAGGEREQTIRAQCLADRALARVIEESELTPERLAHEVDEISGIPQPDWSAIALDGAARSASLIAEEAALASKRAEAWARLRETLKRMARAGRKLDIWLRDDDIVAPSDVSERFLSMLQRLGVPVALAVIPARMEPALAPFLARRPLIDVLTHGWSHANHAPPGDKKSEFPATRPLAEMLNEAMRGLERIRGAFGAQALPVFAPPWNRMAPDLARHISAAGYRGFSTFDAQRAPLESRGALRRDTHLDLIAWPKGGLRDEAELLNRLDDLIGQEDGTPLQPLGVLTHHLVHDGWIDRFLDEMLGTLAESGAIRFRSARDAFELEG